MATFGIEEGYLQALRAALQQAVPEFADWCTLDYYAIDGRLETVHSGYEDLLQEALILEIRRRYRAERGENGEVLGALHSGESILYPNMSELASVRLSPQESALLETLELRSSIVIALQDQGRPLGVVSFVSKSREYQERDRALASEFAERCAEILLARRERMTDSESIELLDKLYRAAPIGLGFLDREFRFQRVNEHLAAINGPSVEEHLGRTLVEVLGELGEEAMPLLERVILEGVTVSSQPEGETQADPGVRHHWDATYSPVHLEGRVVGASVVVRDITERRRFEARSAFLSRAAEILDSSLDFRQTLQSVARLAAGPVADWCSISMRDRRGEMYRLAIAHRDPEKHELAQSLIKRVALPLDAPAGAATAMRTARVSQVEDYTDELLARSLDDQSKRIVEELGIGSSISVPLIARGRMLGAISLISERTHAFAAEDLRLAEELARRAAVVIDNARLHTELSRVANTLQAGLLPRSLPEIPGIELEARYRPAGELNRVGGDFYDVYLRSATEWLVVIGDVTGKGAEAAATTALVRYTLRAAAQHPGSAADLLAELNAAMVKQGANYCTAAVLTIRVEKAGEVSVSTCLAGHHPPLLIRRDGAIDPVGTPGTLLGWTEDPSFSEQQLDLHAQETLLLFTDGLTDASAPPSWSEERLYGVVRDAFHEDLGGMLAAIERVAVADAVGRPRDDIAMLGIRVAGEKGA
jgi:PAS domain S-box-containing protein